MATPPRRPSGFMDAASRAKEAAKAKVGLGKTAAAAPVDAVEAAAREAAKLQEQLRKAQEGVASLAATATQAQVAALTAALQASEAKYKTRSGELVDMEQQRAELDRQIETRIAKLREEHAALQELQRTTAEQIAALTGKAAPTSVAVPPPPVVHSPDARSAVTGAGKPLPPRPNPHTKGESGMGPPPPPPPRPMGGGPQRQGTSDGGDSV